MFDADAVKKRLESFGYEVRAEDDAALALSLIHISEPTRPY